MQREKKKEAKHLQIMQRLGKDTNLFWPTKTWDVSRVGCSYRPKEENVLKMKIRTIGWKTEDHEPMITVTNINLSMKFSVLHNFMCVTALHSHTAFWEIHSFIQIYLFNLLIPSKKIVGDKDHYFYYNNLKTSYIAICI